MSKRRRLSDEADDDKNGPIAIIRNVLSSSELIVLRKEVDTLLKGVDLEKSECVVDIFESVTKKSNDMIRTNQEKYLESRESLLVLKRSEYATIRSLIFEKLPNYLRDILKIKEVFLFNEHYVVKPARSEMEFRWHKDGDLQLVMLRALLGRTKRRNKAYYSFWCALDDVNPKNGTLCFPKDNMIRASAGDVVLFDSETLHCSPANLSDKPRRVFYAQYSTEPIRIPPRGEVLSFAIPCRCCVDDDR